MAIGKPLLVSERKGVQQAVRSAQTQQLSANVPTQKIQFADYRIGQANVQASYAVGNELINMVDAGIKAKMYIDETKREYQRLNLMEEWQQSNIQYNERFAKANTLEAQQEVLDAYSKDNDARTANWRKVMPSTPDSEKYLSAIRTDSQKIHSKFSTTIAQTLNTRTDALEQLNIKRALTDLTTQKNADVVSKMNSIQTSLANRVKIGSLQPEQAEFAYAEAQKGVVAGRVNLFASDFADQNAVSGDVLPEDQALYQMIENAVGFKIDDPDLLRSAKDSYEDAYYKRIGELNREASAEETMVRNRLAQGKVEFESKYKQELAEMDGRTPDEWLNKIVDAGKRFDVAWPGYSRKLERELRNTKWGKASQTQIEYFTEGAGVEYIQQYVKRDGSYFINLEELDYLLHNQKGDHAGMNENTILGIVKHYRRQNDDIQKTVHKASEPILQSSLMSALKNPAILDKEVVNKQLWDAMHKPDFSTSLNWQNVFSLDPDYQTAFQTVKGLIQTAHDQDTGPFQGKYMQLPHNERIVHLEDFIQSQVGKVFGQVTAEKKKQAMQKQAQVESQGEREAQATMSQAFQAGSIDPRTKKRIPGAMAYRTASTAAELENQKIQSFTNMKARIDKEIKRQDYDALSAPVKAIDQLIPDMPKFEIGPLKMSDIGSAIMGSVPTKYVAGQANKQLQATIEEKLGRPLTEAELKGEDSNVNALASELIKEKEKSTLGKVFDWVFSDGSPSESELMMDNLLLDIKFKSLDGINRGVEKTQPPTEAQPTTEVKEESVPVAGQTAVDQLAEGMADNPFMKTLVSGANQLFGAGTEAEAAPASQYAVQAGDTMSSIARQYGIPVNELIALNPNISDPNVIGIGDAINVPAGAPTTAVATPPSIASSVRRNNPFNVQISRSKWRGEVESDSERFMATDTPLNGLRAGYINFLAKLKRGKTVAEMVEIVSPSSDANPTDTMIKVVSDMAGVDPEDKLTVSMDNFDKIKQIGLGLLRFEAPGHNYEDSLIDEAVKLAIEQKSGKSQNTPASLDSEPETLSPSLASEVVPTAPKLYAYAMSGDRGVWKEDVFSGEEQSQLKDIVAKKIKQGKFLISYSDYDEEGGSKIGYGMEMPDSSQGLKFALGKAQIVRHGDKILVVDEWDIDSPEKINEMPFFDKVGTIYEKMRSGDISMYGLAHLMGEAFGPQSGEGASIRATIGTAKSLKLSKAQLAKIPQLKDYEAKNKHRINPDNLGQFA